VRHRDIGCGEPCESLRWRFFLQWFWGPHYEQIGPARSTAHAIPPMHGDRKARPGQSDRNVALGSKHKSAAHVLTEPHDVVRAPCIVKKIAMEAAR